MSFTGNDFLDKLLEQAPPAASQPRHGQNYNYPQRLYLKPDGTVVALQGDPQNRAYYQDKGYHLLSEQPGRGGAKSELKQYVEDEYPKILAEQKEKASIINAIRKAGERDRNSVLEDTFDGWSVEQLRNYLQQIKEETGKTIRIVVPRNTPQARQQEAENRLLQGVETGETIESLQAKVGYDPLEQARRTAKR